MEAETKVYYSQGTLLWVPEEIVRLQVGMYEAHTMEGGQAPASEDISI